MPTVPKGSARPSLVEQPSETDMLMALAVMKNQGILAKLDPSMADPIEDRRGEEDPRLAQEARQVAAERQAASVKSFRRKGDPVMAEFEAMKARRGER